MNNNYVKLLRINHWFKNLFVFFGSLSALWFTKDFTFNLNNLSLFLLSFFLASLVSSANYIINQITDSKYDSKHPEKKNRPVPSGKVSISYSFGFMLILFFACFAISLAIFPFNFTVVLVALWIAGILYNVEPIRLKDVPYVDVVNESINNPIRFLLGWFVVSPVVFPPLALVISTWTAGAILMTAKRYDELLFFGNDLNPYRNTFSHYSLTSLKFMMILYSVGTLLTSTVFLLRYSIEFIILIPINTIFVYWIISQVISGKAKSRSAENFVLSKKFQLFFFISLSIFIIILLK